jgi:hypothetical protein
MRIPACIVLLLCLSATVMAQRPDPYQPSSEAAVRSHCLAVGQVILSAQNEDPYRVEVLWNVAEKVTPNCELMAGIPGTQHRAYSVLTLPTRWAIGQIGSAISSEIQDKAHPGILRRIGRVIKNIFTSSHPELVVKGPAGVVEEVKEFSAKKVVD